MLAAELWKATSLLIANHSGFIEVVNIISSEPLDFHGILARVIVNWLPPVLSDPWCVPVMQSTFPSYGSLIDIILPGRMGCGEALKTRGHAMSYRAAPSALGHSRSEDQRYQFCLILRLHCFPFVFGVAAEMGKPCFCPRIALLSLLFSLWSPLEILSD